MLFESGRKVQNLPQVNRTLYRTERGFGHPEGLPGRDWYRHQIYAPGLDTGYGVKTVPGVREGIDRRNWDETRRMMGVVIGALNAVTEQIVEAAALLE